LAASFKDDYGKVSVEGINLESRPYKSSGPIIVSN